MKTTECHDIVIHEPGYIQSFGYLIGINISTGLIEFFSSNVPNLFNIEGSLLQTNIQEVKVFNIISESRHYDFVRRSAEEGVKYIDRIFLTGKDFHITYYKHGNFIYIEIEQCILEAKDNSLLVKKINNLISFTHGGNIWDFLVEKIKDLTDYDRVMIYCFNEDKTGTVVAEAKNDNMESYLNLHYPESDIPAQARALYLKNFKRILSNVNDIPVKILSTNEKVDLSLSSVRPLSPIHVEYLINARIASSFSISIVIDNKLWGLVTCHSTYQKHIDLDHRISAEIATFIAANSYNSYLSSNKISFEDNLNQRCFQLKKNLLAHKNIDDSLKHNINQLRSIAETDGVAFRIDGKIQTDGHTPNVAVIENIASWVRKNVKDDYYFSDSFYKDAGKELMLDKKSCGIAISFLNKTNGNIMIWFRGEHKQNIIWAGKKENKIKTIKFFDESKRVVSPRLSFENFNEEILEKSRHWSTQDRKRIFKIKELIDHTIQEQMYHLTHLNEELSQVNSELTRVNEELYSYSHTISHDLATPLTVMKLNMQIMARVNTDHKNINHINTVLNEIDNMSEMMNNVLKLSRLKYSEYKIEEIDPRPMIEKAVSDAKLSYNDGAIITIGNIFKIRGEKSLVGQVFQNIITNAVKYSAKKEEKANITISSYPQDDNIVFEIVDNGIGIPYTSKKEVFKIFNRMSNTKSYFGSGVGLSIVENIMRKLNGKVDFESKVEEGTRFILTFSSPWI